MPARDGVTLTWSKRKRRTIKLALLLLSLTVGFALSEVALRLVGYSFPTFYTTDQERGFRLRPNTAGWYRKEGEAYVRINSAGMRDRDHETAKPPNTFRIAIVGDSYAEALQVPLEQTFWALMEKRLQGCPAVAGRNVEVLNFGVSGYSTAQELITIQRDVFAYSPDVVLLIFTTNNDITDNSRALKRTDEIPYFVFREGHLVLDDSFRNSRAFRLRSSIPNQALTWLRDNSRVLQAFHHAQYAFKNYLERRRARSAAASAPTPQPERNNNSPDATQPAVNPEEVGIDNLIYRPPLDGVWEDAWRVTEGLIVMMRDEVKNHGAQFVVVVGSNSPQVLPDPARRAEILSRVGGTDIFYPDRRIRALGSREGIAVITLAPELQAYAEQHKVYLHGFGAGVGNGHWNIEGHRVSGELLADKLCGELLK
jgi:hypothetical protein